MREYRSAMLAAIKNQHNYWSKHYKSAVTDDSGVYNDGKILGNELVTDGLFNNGGASWNTGSSSITFPSNTCQFASVSNASVYQLLSLKIGVTYKFTFTIVSITTGSLGARLTGDKTGIERTSVGTYTDYLQTSSTVTGFGIIGLNFTNAVIDNISVKEVLTDSIITDYYKMSQLNNMYKSIQFAWLGEAGIKNVSNRISKAYTLAYGGERLGSELITNQADREFTNPSTVFWSKRGNATISGGFGNIVNGTAFQDGFEMTVIAGKKYRISVEVANYISGNPYLNDGGGTYNDIPNANGIYTFDFTSTLGYIRFTTGSATNSFSYDNISVKEVLQASGTTDATQTTVANQPYLKGFIAPTERPCLNNPNGGSNFMTHPTISFGASNSWSVSLLFNNPMSNSTQVILGDGDGSSNNNTLAINSSGKIAIYDSVQILYQSTKTYNQYFGKNTLFTFTANGTSFLIYVNGIYQETITMNTAFVFSNIYAGRGSGGYAYGKVYGYVLRSGILTQAQITAEYNYFRSYIPEIESVQIGTQTWATSNCEQIATPQGNLIAEMQSAVTWATSQTLYDNAYAATAGTVEQKTYAAVKAAAMWCHYDNDISIGAIYGKLYNWFAVKLLQMDIDYYNIANPTALWGWRIVTEADCNTLNIYLGGSTTSAIKTKINGTTYWSSPNTGDNSSGLSLLGSGRRLDAGVFSALGSNMKLWTVSSIDNTTAYAMQIYNNADSMYVTSNLNVYGYSIRLIKV